MMLSLKVEAGAGEHIRDILWEMAQLATRTGCMVRSNLNGIEAMVKPGAYGSASATLSILWPTIWSASNASFNT
jgi:hypothetical protein